MEASSHVSKKAGKRAGKLAIRQASKQAIIDNDFSYKLRPFRAIFCAP